MRKETHLKELVGLLSKQSVGNAEGIRSIFLVELTQQLGKTSVYFILAILSLQTLWTNRSDKLDKMTFSS